jgi:hypothetical protein
MSTTLYIPTGNKCEGCPALYSVSTDEDTCGLAAMWGESGAGSVGIEDGKKSQACLEDTRLTPTKVTAERDERKRRKP